MEGLVVNVVARKGHSDAERTVQASCRWAPTEQRLVAIGRRPHRSDPLVAVYVLRKPVHHSLDVIAKRNNCRSKARGAVVVEYDACTAQREGHEILRWRAAATRHTSAVEFENGVCGDHWVESMENGVLWRNVDLHAKLVALQVQDRTEERKRLNDCLHAGVAQAQWA